MTKSKTLRSAVAVLAALFIAGPMVLAQQPLHDDIARIEIAQLKETVAALERKYSELRAADELRTEQRFAAQEKALILALASLKEAFDKFERAQEKRFESVNEFRGQLKDQAGTFVTRAELWAAVTSALFLGMAAAGLLIRLRSRKAGVQV